MAKRIQSNTSALKQRFKEIYQDFFARCFLVVSCPGNFWIVGEHAALYEGVGAKQNLPLRGYCGLKKIAKGFKVKQEFKFYVPSKQDFSEYRFSDPTNEMLEQQIPKVIKEHYGADLDGIEIELLSEVPVMCGLGASGALSSTMALALLHHLGLVKKEHVDSWSEYDTDDPKFAKKEFDLVFRLSWYLDTILQEGTSSGAACFASLVGSYLPIIYSADSTKGFDEPFDYFARNYVGFKLNSFLPKGSAAWSWPISYGLVFMGPRGTTGSVLRSAKWLRENSHDLFNFFSKRLDQKKYKQLKLSASILQSQGQDYWLTYMRLLSILSLDTVKLLINLFERGAQDESYSWFCSNINYYHQNLSYIGVASQVTDRLSAMLVTGQNNFEVAVKISGAGGGGDAVIFLPHGHHEKLSEYINIFNINNDIDLVLDYYSETDGLEDNGAVLEQNLATGLLSEVIPAGSVSVTFFENRTQRKILLPYDKVAEIISESDLVFEGVLKDIYFKGEQADSTQLKTSKATVEVFAILLKNLGQPVQNTAFPASSYVKDKNEFMSKIVLPLASIIKKKFRKNLDVQVSGGYGKFTVKLNQPNFKVVLIEQMS